MFVIVIVDTIRAVVTVTAVRNLIITTSITTICVVHFLLGAGDRHLGGVPGG